MWIVCLLLIQQDAFVPASLQATLFTDSGEEVELYDFRIAGPDPYAISLEANGTSDFIPLAQVTRITALARQGTYQLILDTGETLTGRIGTISFEGVNPEQPKSSFAMSIRRISRIHIVSGSQMRSCQVCSYEATTDYPFCPACGSLLDIGPYEEEEAQAQPPPPLYRYRLNERNPRSNSGGN